MNAKVHLRKAEAREAATLSALAIRSKSHWGYSKSFLDQCRSELTVTTEDIETQNINCFVAEVDGKLVGYGGVILTPDNEYELDALFVEPAFIGGGIGRMLLDKILENVHSNGGRSLIVQSDPNAAEFYRACGGTETGKSQSSSISGRLLPVFKFATRRSERVG